MNPPFQTYNISDLNILKQHSERVGILALKLGKILNINENLINNLLIAGKYHDIGKYLIPMDIIFKPGKLTKEEFKIIKNHSNYAYFLMKDLNFNDNICKIIKYHHENYDGTGYPESLKGKKIPIESRILKICDVFDALTSERVYKHKMDIDEALKIMEEEIATFDVIIFSVFKESLKNNKKFIIKK